MPARLIMAPPIERIAARLRLSVLLGLPDPFHCPPCERIELVGRWMSEGQDYPADHTDRIHLRQCERCGRSPLAEEYRAFDKRTLDSIRTLARSYQSVSDVSPDVVNRWVDAEPTYSHPESEWDEDIENAEWGRREWERGEIPNMLAWRAVQVATLLSHVVVEFGATHGLGRHIPAWRDADDMRLVSWAESMPDDELGAVHAASRFGTVLVVDNRSLPIHLPALAGDLESIEGFVVAEPYYSGDLAEHWLDKFDGRRVVLASWSRVLRLRLDTSLEKGSSVTERLESILAVQVPTIDLLERIAANTDQANRSRAEECVKSAVGQNFFARLCTDARMWLVTAEQLNRIPAIAIPSLSVFALARAFEAQFKSTILEPFSQFLIKRGAREVQGFITGGRLHSLTLGEARRALTAQGADFSAFCTAHRLDATAIHATLSRVLPLRNASAHNDLSALRVAQVRDDWLGNPGGCGGIFAPLLDA